MTQPQHCGKCKNCEAVNHWKDKVFEDARHATDNEEFMPLDAVNNWNFTIKEHFKCLNPPTKIPQHCGKCKNCERLDAIKSQTLAAVNQAANKGVAVDQGMIDMWNDVVSVYPCTGEDT